MLTSTKLIRLDRSRTSLIAEPDIGADLPADLVSEWREQLVRYAQYWQWMDGTIWDEIDRYFVAQRGQEPPLLWPLQLNPVYTAAILHRNALFGEVPDTGRPMVRPIALPKHDAKFKTNDKARDTAKFVSEVLEQIWYHSHGRSNMLDAGFVSQSLGGTVWKASYEPWNELLTPGLPLAFRSVEPEFFLPVYTLKDRWSLMECRIGRMIDAYEAEKIYSVPIGSKDRVLYLEKWDRQNLSVTVDGKPASIMKGDVQVPLSITHGYGFVPCVYVPHEIVGQFYGVPIIHQLGNLVKELNGRAADVGDAVRNSIERVYVSTNCDAGDIRFKDLGGGIKVLVTGREMAGTQPKRIEHVAPPDLPRGTMEFLAWLEKTTWHNMFTPAVAYGEDEGSQRSALTLAFRMWPLTSHIRTERSLWTEGLRVLEDMALKILLKKQTGDYGDLAKGTPWKLTEEHIGHKIMQEWAPMIPRDREAEVNELILRHQDEQISARTAMEKLGDIQDIDQELEDIRVELDEKAEREVKLAGQTAREGPLVDRQEPIAKVEAD